MRMRAKDVIEEDREVLDSIEKTKSVLVGEMDGVKSSMAAICEMLSTQKPIQPSVTVRRPVDYEFTVKHDADGRIVKILARAINRNESLN